MSKLGLTAQLATWAAVTLFSWLIKTLLLHFVGVLHLGVFHFHVVLLAVIHAVVCKAHA